MSRVFVFRQIINMGIFDFFKPKKSGIADKTFNSEQYQREILALALTFYRDSKHNYEEAADMLKANGLNDSQCHQVIEKLRAFNAAAVNQFENELNTGQITSIKISPNPEHQKGNVNKEQVDRYIGYGAYQMQRGDYANALELFDKAIELDERAALAYANKGTLYSETGDPGKAIHFYDLALQYETNDAKIYVNKAIALEDLNRVEEAVDAYKEALRIDPYNQQAINNIGVHYSSAKNYQLALSYFDRLLELNPQDTDAKINRLTSLANLDMPAAIAYYGQLSREIPNQAEIYAIIPHVYYEKGDQSAAEDFFDRQVSIGPKRLKMMKANFYYSRDVEKALGLYDEILNDEPQSEKALTSKFYLLQQLQKPEQMQEVMDRLLAIGSKDPNVLLHKIYNSTHQGDVDSAWPYMTLLFKDLYNDHSVIGAMLNTLDKMTQPDALSKIAAFATELKDEANYQLMYCKGLYLKDKRQYEEAVQTFNSLNDRYDFACNYYQIAIIKNTQQKTDECLSYLKTSFELDPALKLDAQQYRELENLRNDERFIRLTRN